jgi:hypothetical protein
MNSLTPGHIIKVLDSNQSSSGVIVDIEANSLIYFRLNHNHEPIFNRVDEYQKYNIEKSGHINQNEYAELKKALLKYYHQHKTSKEEITILKKVMDFAYPNGIPSLPQHQQNLHINKNNLNNLNESLNEDQKEGLKEGLNEDSLYLENGCQIKLKCPRTASISFLNDQVVDIVDTYSKGIRVLRRGASGQTNKYYTLFFRRPGQDNSLAGVEEVEILNRNSNLTQNLNDKVKEQLKNVRDRDDTGNLKYNTQIIDENGQIFNINPNTLEVKSLDQKKTGKYNPATDTIIFQKSTKNSTFATDEDDEEDELDLGRRLKDSEDPLKKIASTIVAVDVEDDDDDMEVDLLRRLDKKDNSSVPLKDIMDDIDEVNMDEEDEMDEEDNNNVKRGGGSRNKLDDKLKNKLKTDMDSEVDISTITLGTLDEESEGLESMSSKLTTFESDDFTNDGDESEGDEYDFEELDVIDEPIELSKVVYRSKKVPVPDEKKIYEPHVQKSEFYKYLIEKLIPNKQLRKNAFLVNQIHQINNLMNRLKDESAKLHSEENPFKEDYRPLINKYLQNDYRSRFLIPIVLDRKKLYFRNNENDYHYDFYQNNSNILFKNYLQVISDLITRVDQKNSSKISSSTYFQLEKAINEMLSPFKSNEDSKIIGDIGRIADGVSDRELPFDDFSTLVVRYNKSPFKNQGVDFQESEIEGYNMQSPLIYYQETFKNKTNEELDQEEDELVAEDPDKEWIYEEQMETSLENAPKFKKIIDGERFNIVGYLALPLNYAFNKPQLDFDSLTGIHQFYKNGVGLRDKLLDKDYVSSKILKYRNKPTFFYLPENLPTDKQEKERHLKSLIPTFKEICREHYSELLQSTNWTQLEKVISKYGYSLRTLGDSDWNELKTILQTSVEHQTFNLSKRWTDYQKFLIHESSANKKNVRHCPLVDKMVLEELENYYDIYPLLNESIDNDTTRLSWTLNKADHGKLLELILARNQLVEDEKNLNLGQIDKEIVKVQKELGVLEDRYKKELQLTNYFDSKDKNKCATRPKYNVSKIYHNIKDLEADNYKVAKTTVGNLDVMVGDYAVLNGKKVYIRIELPNQRQVWEQSSINPEQLEELIKKECQAPGLDKVSEVVKGQECQYQVNDYKCWPGHIDRVYRLINHNKELLNVLNTERQQINNLKTHKNALEKEIGKARSFLRSQRNLDRLKRENRLASYQQIIDDVKKAQQHKKDCPHFQVINYFFRMKHITLREKYLLSYTILQKFQDLTPNFTKYLGNNLSKEDGVKDEFNFEEYGKFDVIHPDDNMNWTYCNLCHQKLICNHHLYAHSIIQQTGDLNEKILKDLYGLEVDQNYNCRVCGEHLVTGEEIDMDGFVKKADKNDQRLITREVLDQTAERQQIQQNLLDQLLDDVDNKHDQESNDMKLFLNTLQSLKSLTRIDLLSQDQEDIISFIKSDPFLTREYFKEYLRKSMQIANQQLLDYQANQFFYRFAIYDITSRFLIVIQTSEMTYSLSNDLCRGHLGGYPLGELHDLSTVKYFACLLEKMGSIPEWNFLAKETNIESRFLGRLKIMSQSQKVEQLYQRAIERRATQIFHDDPFLKNPTNNWLGYRPILGIIDTKWTPKHSINPKTVHKVITKKYDDFLCDLRMNLSHRSSKIFEAIHTIISQENPAVSFHNNIKLGNSCCLTKVKSNDGGSYYQFLFKKEPQLEGLIDELKALDILKLKLERRIGHVGPIPSFMKVDAVFQLDPYFHINQEYKLSEDMKRKLFETYVNIGLNRGLPRIFNAFDVCTLSGESRHEILGSEYNNQDYNLLIHDIRKKGKISVVKPAELNHKKILIQSLQNYLSKNNQIKDGDFLAVFLNGFISLLESEDLTQKDLGKHWTKLDQQINQEVSTLVQHLNVIKNNPHMKDKLYRLGDYSNLYQQEDIANIDKEPKEKQGDLFKEANHKRYMRFEKNIRHYIFNFFRLTLAKIKNGSFDDFQPSEMNEQWKDLQQFKNNRKLFNEVFKTFTGLTNCLETIKGSQYSHFTYFNSSSLYKCILLIILNRIISTQPKTKNSSKQGLVVRKNDEVEDAIDVDVDGITNNINQKDDETTESQKDLDDQIRNFNLQKFSDQKIMILYVDIILNKIMKEEDTFDHLTQDYMTIVADGAKEERNRKNLKLIAHLAAEGRKDFRKVIMDQKRLGLIDYEDFADILQKDIQAGEDQPIFDRDMEILDELAENPDVPGDVIEKKRQDKLIDLEIEEEEYSYVAGEDDDFDDF